MTDELKGLFLKLLFDLGWVFGGFVVLTLVMLVFVSIVVSKTAE